ncbi:hypothetical protein L6164_026225 [Bauhinia variegata]|uniref:Uncharacterized protein n=1 Tax=Bauhinia variegata TaxID=167791 RepID=A0ACB9LP00_BAUVA|nr:hypothetical protein L6164_026225 [Bauhinia variegata]
MGLEGSIPARIATLRIVVLSNNKLSGEIPSSFSNLTQLVELDLSHNRISGFIPPKIGNSTNLEKLDLSSNNLSGPIPSSLGNLKHLNVLDLSENHLVGPIPLSLYELTNLTSIFHHSNNRGGYIHPNIGKLFELVNCDISHNMITGGIPSELGGKHHIDIILPITSFFIVLFVGDLLFYQYANNVYRAKLPMGRIVAIKKLQRMESKNPTFAKSFCNEIKMLTEIRHRNIVKLHGFCLHKRCMFLIYEYIERGSLFCALSNDFDVQELNWGKRVNIIKGIAHALAYMHHGCTPTSIHRDITSNNVLLNSEMEAIVSDFGTARFLDPDSSNQTLLVGTYGYVAPMALEAIMGKHPGELISLLSKPNSVNIMLKEVIDQSLHLPKLQKEIQVVILMTTLALACVQQTPKLRPSVQEVAQQLSVSKPPMIVSFNEISIQQLMNQEIYPAGSN